MNAGAGAWLLGAWLAGVPAGDVVARESCFGAPETAGSCDVGNTPQSVAVGDVNGDGAFDLAVANQYSNDAGDGTFAEQVRYAAGPAPRT